MKAEEYIIPINETAKEYDEMFVGVIRRQPVLIRCKDCKHRPYKDEFGFIDGDYCCPYLCDDPFYSVMPRDDWFCHRGERRDDDHTR